MTFVTGCSPRCELVNTGTELACSFRGKLAHARRDDAARFCDGPCAPNGWRRALPSGGSRFDFAGGGDVLTRRFDRTFPRVLVAIIATPPPALRLVRYVE